jgi:predicted tellurium resistance membrane protein TerC
MNMHEFSDWLSATPLSQLIQVTSWAIPSLQVVHIICLATLFASAIVVAMRMAGRGLAAEPLPQLAARFLSVMWVCLALLLLTGSLLITAEPGRTITNPVFYTKMCLLVVAVSITLWLGSVARRKLERPGKVHVAAAAFTLLLWASIMVAGRYIAYVESY